MDIMVLIVGDLRRGEDDDCTCSHDLMEVPKQVHAEGQRLHVGGDVLKAVSVNSQFRTISWWMNR